MKIGILGGGIAGVTLQKYINADTEILEATDRPGGLCQTYFKDGFGYDLGGHILFSKNEDINKTVDELLKGNIVQNKRLNLILLNGQYVKYPFENDLGSLNKEDTYDCLIGYLKNDYDKKPTNLKEWSYATFGKGISEKYFIPYNEKIWNISAEDLSLEFVERIPKPPLEDVVRSAVGIETEGYLHQLYFRYPKKGGAESLVKSLIEDNANIRCNYKIKSITKDGEQWIVSDGQSDIAYDRIVLSLPIHEALPFFKDIPEEVSRAVENLRYNSIRVAMIAVNNESLMDKSAVYIPDPEVLPHRICYMGFFSKELVKPGTSSLIAEITTNEGDGVHELSDDEVIERTVRDLDRIGIIKKEDVIVTDITNSKYAYPVYTHTYTKNVKIMRDYFAGIGIDLCGRFAEFEYINSDEVMRRAMSLAERINSSK